MGGSSQRHCSGGATKLREWHAPDVRTESHQINEMSVERGNHEAGARDGNDQINFIRAHTRALEAFFRRFSSELDGVLDVFLIGLIEGARFDRVLDRENRMALVHLSI